MLGFTFRAIANKVGIQVSAVHRHVTKASEELKELNVEAAKNYHAIQLERYENLFLKLQTQVGKGEVAAIGQATRVLDSINRLMGLDAPQKIAPTTPDGKAQYNPLHDLTPEERQARIKELEAKRKQ